MENTILLAIIVLITILYVDRSLRRKYLSKGTVKKVENNR